MVEERNFFFYSWGTSRSEPSPPVVATKIYGRSCIGVQLNVLWLGDDVLIEEGNAIPKSQEMLPQAHLRFACLVQNNSLMERGDGCGFDLKIGQEG